MDTLIHFSLHLNSCSTTIKLEELAYSYFVEAITKMLKRPWG